METKIDIAALCAERGLRLTAQRQAVVEVISNSDDHPSVEIIHQRATEADSKIAVATVYRTVRLLEEAGLLQRHDFGDGSARFEINQDTHHDHLIDVQTGKVVEFLDPELEQLQKQIAEKLGFKLVDHRMELYGVKLDTKD